MIHLSVYAVDEAGARRQLVEPAAFAPAEPPSMATTMDLPCHCPQHRDGQALSPRVAPYPGTQS